jgi:hypothetical protein
MTLGSGAPFVPRTRRISSRSSRDKAFRQQKARDQSLIMARRAHRERETPPSRISSGSSTASRRQLPQTGAAELARRMPADAVGVRDALR